MADTSAAVASGKRGPKVADKDYFAPDETEPRENMRVKGDYLYRFADGRELRGNIFADFPAPIVEQLAMHGFIQRGGDSYASVKGDVDKAYGNCSRVIEQLRAGEWGATREGGGAGNVLWVMALARLKKWFVKDTEGNLVEEDGRPKLDMAFARKRIEEIAEGPNGEALIEATKKSDPIKAEVTKIQAERAAAALRAAEAAAAKSGVSAEQALAAF